MRFLCAELSPSSTTSILMNPLIFCHHIYVGDKTKKSLNYIKLLTILIVDIITCLDGKISYLVQEPK
jgi:hypothetical protein